jgi:predicted nucleotidyltransferase
MGISAPAVQYTAAMDANGVQKQIAGLTEQLGTLGVRSLSLFGSAAKGVAKDGSDLDFLVEFVGPATFDRYMSLKELLEEEFKVKIDLVTLRALKPVIREQILREAVKVA